MVLCKNDNGRQSSLDGFIIINDLDFVIFPFVCLFVAFLSFVIFFYKKFLFARTPWVFRVAESRELQQCDSVMHSPFEICGEEKSRSQKNPERMQIKVQKKLGRIGPSASLTE